MNPSQGDPTPVVGAATDITPLGRSGEKPAHERTADDEISNIDWHQAAANPAFKDLLHKKAVFIIPCCIFFVIYYFALPVLVGYAPKLMETELLGVNVAYLFALSQFFMAWTIAGLYVRAAGRFDRDAEAIVKTITSK